VNSSGGVSSSCSTCDTRRITLDTNPLISHEKKILCTAPVDAYRQQDGKFIFDTDESNVGITAVPQEEFESASVDRRRTDNTKTKSKGQKNKRSNKILHRNQTKNRR
jgi:hypothetical protein